MGRPRGVIVTSGRGGVCPQEILLVLVMGSRRIRVPVRAAIALVSAGAAVGTLLRPEQGPDVPLEAELVAFAG